MEAMSCGMPVVASRLSGIPELVIDEQTGLLVPPRDAEAIALALQRLHGDQPLRQRLGHAARAKVVEEFDLFKNAATLAGLFRTVATRRGDTFTRRPAVVTAQAEGAS
jgi:colanic acid/amylovoran biosynthesis glycosyltransferase